MQRDTINNEARETGYTVTIPCKPRLEVTLNFFDTTHSFSSQSLWMGLFFTWSSLAVLILHISACKLLSWRFFHDFTGYTWSSHYTHSEHVCNLQIHWWLTYHCLMTHIIIYTSDYGDQISSSAQDWGGGGLPECGIFSARTRQVPGHHVRMSVLQCQELYWSCPHCTLWTYRSAL